MFNVRFRPGEQDKPPLRIVPINEAEAIVEPFWDWCALGDPGDAQRHLRAYRIQVDPEASVRVEPAWCSLAIHIGRAPIGRPALVMERDCDLDVREYDRLRLLAAAPSRVRIALRARVDGRVRALLPGTPGADTTDEFDAPFHGRRITAVRLEFALVESGPAGIDLFWLGLSHRVRQTRMEQRKSPYSPRWTGLLATRPAPLTTEIGLFFDQPGLSELRRRARTALFKPAFDDLRREAQKARKMRPEADIGKLAPAPVRRWCRNRDMLRSETHEWMKTLAFVGLVDNRPELSRVAARMALSLAHCDTWCETDMGVFPGGLWHHRSFTEARLAAACAVVLDWAGACLTDRGKAVIREAIVMKGLPRIESDFHRQEYIRHMNQGMLFSLGRILGLLALLPAYPRYASDLARAESDLRENVEAYILPDGGVLEGPGYWSGCLAHAVPAFFALARHHGRPFGKIAPRALTRTAEYGLALRSTAGDGLFMLPINDTHAGCFHPALLAAFCRLTDRPELHALYAATVRSRQGRRSVEHLLLAPASSRPVRRLPVERFLVLPVTGHVTSVRRDRRLGPVLFHLCSTAKEWSGHCHEDSGHFMIEAGGEALALDRGTTPYDHPETKLIGTAGRHNVLCPEDETGAVPRRPPEAPGGKLVSALQRSGNVLAACDNAGDWPAGLFRCNFRRVFSPAPDLYVIDDDVRLDGEWAVSFRLNSRGRIRSRHGTWEVRGKRAVLLVTPLNWSPYDTTAREEGVDADLRPVQLLRLATEPAPSHRLLTMIQLVPAGQRATRRWRIGDGSCVRRRGGRVEWDIDRNLLAVRIHVAGKPPVHARCRGGQWRVRAG